MAAARAANSAQLGSARNTEAIASCHSTMTCTIHDDASVRVHVALRRMAQQRVLLGAAALLLLACGALAGPVEVPVTTELPAPDTVYSGVADPTPGVRVCSCSAVPVYEQRFPVQMLVMRTLNLRI
jgi:hypothetical protein